LAVEAVDAMASRRGLGAFEGDALAQAAKLSMGGMVNE